MARPNICQPPDYFATTPERLWHTVPPLFDTSDGTPISAADREIALDLIETLDPIGQRWYANAARELRRDLGRP